MSHPGEPDDAPIDDPVLDLPELGDGDDEARIDDVDDELPVVDDGEANPLDDAVASDIPIDIVLSTTVEESSVIGDDATGLEDSATSEGIAIDETSGSLIDSEDDPTGFGGHEELGIDPIPREVDDGGLEGLDDPVGERVDDDQFPPLDGDEEDEASEVELGIEINTSDAPPKV